MKASRAQDHRAHFPGMKSNVGPALLLIGTLLVIVIPHTSRQRAAQPAALMAAQLAETGTPTAALTRVPPVTPTITATAHCSWVGYARAFIDENANGQEDAGEPALAGVTFFVDDLLYNFKKVSTAVSKAEESAMLVVESSSCYNSAFEVYAEIPQGYALTTPSRLKVPEGSFNDIFSFGFKKIDPTPTAGALPGMPVTGKLDSYSQPSENRTATPALPSLTPTRSAGFMLAAPGMAKPKPSLKLAQMGCGHK
ncbi:MAG TPA: hypothetical protein VF826_15150 [Chloroflexia bacterium]